MVNSYASNRQGCAHSMNDTPLPLPGQLNSFECSFDCLFADWHASWISLSKPDCSWFWKGEIGKVGLDESLFGDSPDQPPPFPPTVEVGVDIEFIGNHG